MRPSPTAKIPSPALVPTSSPATVGDNIPSKQILQNKDKEILQTESEGKNPKENQKGDQKTKDMHNKKKDKKDYKDNILSLIRRSKGKVSSMITIVSKEADI